MARSPGRGKDFQWSGSVLSRSDVEEADQGVSSDVLDIREVVIPETGALDRGAWARQVPLPVDLEH